MLWPLLGDSGKRVFFAIDAVGVDVTLYSTHAKEGEMLLLPGSMLRVEEAVPEQHGPGPDDTLWEYMLVSKADDGQNLDFHKNCAVKSLIFKHCRRYGPKYWVCKLF